MTIVELEQEVGISHRSIHAILSDDLKMRHISAIMQQFFAKKIIPASPNHRTLQILP
jgi:hypothetical protein